METISLVVGDWSHDGHEKTDTIVIKSSLTLKQLQSAYKKGTEKVGFDFMKTVATDYEESNIDRNKLKVLRDLGCETAVWEEDYKNSLSEKDKEIYAGDDDKAVSISSEEYAEFVLFICTLGNKDLEYEFVEDKTSRWNIGGYGLFY